MASKIRLTRRMLLATGVGALGATLVGCFAERSDITAVQEALNQALSAVPGYLQGTVHFQDGAGPGTFMNGTVVVDSSSREETEQILGRIHEALVRTYLTQPRTRTAIVNLRAHPPEDYQAHVDSRDIAQDDQGRAPTTDSLAKDFGL